MDAPARVRVRLFGPARSAFGWSTSEVSGATVGEVVGALTRGGTAEQAAVLATCGCWVNGEPAGEDTPLGAGDELALLPPVSGGER